MANDGKTLLSPYGCIVGKLTKSDDILTFVKGFRTAEIQELYFRTFPERAQEWRAAQYRQNGKEFFVQLYSAVEQWKGSDYAELFKERKKLDDFVAEYSAAQEQYRLPRIPLLEGYAQLSVQAQKLDVTAQSYASLLADGTFTRQQLQQLVALPSQLETLVQQHIPNRFLFFKNSSPAFTFPEKKIQYNELAKSAQYYLHNFNNIQTLLQQYGAQNKELSQAIQRVQSVLEDTPPSIDLSVQMLASLPNQYNELAAIACLIKENWQLRQRYTALLEQVAAKVWNGVHTLLMAIPDGKEKLQYYSTALQQLVVYEHQFRALGKAIRIDLSPLTSIKEEFVRMQQTEERVLTRPIIVSHPLSLDMRKSIALHI